MATQVQFRRGTTTQNNAFTGAIGELTYDTEIKTLRIHDGTTPGGGAILLNGNSAQTATNKTLSTGSVWQGTPVSLTYGGTGAALTAVAGAVAYSTGSALALSPAGTSGQVLISGGSSSPTWVNASSITAGSSTNATFATNIAGGSAGQLVIQQDTGLTTFITAGANGTFLRSAGAGYAPTWATADVTVGSTVIALGSASTSIAGLTAIDGTSGATSFFATPTSPTIFAAGTSITIGATTGTTTVRNNLTITGDLTVNGTTTTVNATTLTVDDKNIELGSVTTPTNTTADGGGITLKGTTDKTIIWDNANTNWTSSEHWNIATGKTFKIDNVPVVTSTTVLNDSTQTSIGVGGYATSVSIGASTGTTTINHDLAVNGGDIVTTASTFNLLNANATTVTAFGAATALSLGAATGTFTVNNSEFVHNSTNYTKIAVGTTAQRPGSPAVGMIRYNSDQSAFEGYASGAWASLGGVKSVDGYTYIIAETSPTASNGDLDFYAENAGGTAAQQVGQWNRTNLKDYTGTIVGTQTTQNVFNATATTVNAFGASTALTLGATTGTATIRNATVAITNAATIGSTLGVTGATTLSSTLGVTGATTLSSALTYGGVTLSNSVTGTGSMVLSASPTFTGTSNFAAISTTGNTSVGGSLTVTGDLTINGTTTTVNSTTITVDDKNIELGSIASPTNTTADGGGITLKGTTDKTFNWVNATGAWTSSEHISLAAGKNIFLNGSTSGTVTLAVPAAAGTTTITFPATTGTVVTTGDNGTVTSTMIADGTIVNADINASAAIAISKLAASTISGKSLGTNLDTLTLNVSGTGLSGSTTYNGSAAATFTVTSNATSANTASTIVARDASGNFSAGTITATLNGNASTATSATSATTATTASTANALNTSNSYTVAGMTLNSGAYVGTHSSWTGEQNKIQWHSSHLYFQNTDSGRLAVFRRSNGAEPCTIDNSGNLTAASVTSSSDIKLKENVETISNVATLINGLRGVTFDWKSNGKKSYGFIAQEVEQVLPELVTETVDNSLDPNSETTKAVDYDKIVSILVEGWKEQQTKIETLQQEVASLKAKLGE